MNQQIGLLFWQMVAKIFRLLKYTILFQNRIHRRAHHFAGACFFLGLIVYGIIITKYLCSKSIILKHHHYPKVLRFNFNVKFDVFAWCFHLLDYCYNIYYIIWYTRHFQNIFLKCCKFASLLLHIDMVKSLWWKCFKLLDQDFLKSMTDLVTY